MFFNMAADELTSKVRLVRCPKCRLLLPEPDHVEVYSCGGCGATLQAKNRINGMRSKSSSFSETMAARKIGSDHVSEDKLSSISSRKATLPDSGECSSHQNNGRDQSKSLEGNKSSSSSDNNPTFPGSGECFSGHNSESKSSQGNEPSSSSTPKASVPDSGECSSDQNNEKSEDKSAQDEESCSSSHYASLSNSGECSSDGSNERDQSKSSEGNESSSSSPRATFPDSGECFSDQNNERDLDQNNERDQSKSLEGNQFSSSSPKATFPDLGRCFSEQNNEKGQNKSSGDKEFGSSSHKDVLPDSGECTSNHFNRRNHDKSSEDRDREQLGDINLPKEDKNNQSDGNDSSEFDSGQLEVFNEICSSTQFAHNEIKESLPIAHAGSEVSLNDESSPLAETNVEVDIDKEIDSDFRSSSAVNPGATMGSSSIVTTHIPARESISSDSHTSSPNEQLEEPQNSVLNGFDHIKSPDAYENREFNTSPEFSGAPRDMSKFPANRSHHAYDGSVSSYDGMDDQFFSRNVRSNFVHSEQRPRRDKFLVKGTMKRDSGLPHQARDSWSDLSDQNDHAMKYRKWDQDEFLLPRRPGHPSRDWNRLQSGEYMSWMAFPRRVSQDGYENGGPTNRLHNEYQRKSGYQSSEKSVDAEQDNMTLLRMVYELQDQVNNLNGRASGRVAGGATLNEKRIPQYRSYEASEEGLFHDPNYQRYLRSRKAGNLYPPQHHKFMPVPFSSEATTSRHQVDPSYLHRGPQDWQCSAPLPLPVRCSDNGLCRVHPGHSSSTSYDKSSPSSPEQYVEPDFPLRGRETMSDDLRHRRHDVKKFFREQHHLAKRHFRPIAGGAPIITCYNCLKSLQIPADFLLFKRRCHKLRCGACSEVLKFSLQKRSHIVPYEQSAIAPPPSEVGDYSAAVNGVNSASTSQDVDPVSCSDDYGYGLAYRKSYSTEGEPGTLAPSNSLRGDSNDRNMLYDPMRERTELALKQSHNKDKNPVETYVSARPSLSSEIEELPQTSSSPLHRLMGYSSPSQVIRGSGSSHLGTSSYSRLR